MMGQLTLGEALHRLEGVYNLSANGKDFYPVPTIRTACEALPGLLESPCRLSTDHLSYLAADGASVAGWALRPCMQNDTFPSGGTDVP